MNRKIIVVAALVLLVYPSFNTRVQANPIAAPECKYRCISPKDLQDTQTEDTQD